VLQYINDNKTWIFSGIGVLVISFAVWIFRILWKKVWSSKPAMTLVGTSTVRAVPIAPAKRFANITPDIIINEIKRAPLLQRKTVANAYVGLWVKWEAKLGLAWETADGKIRLALVQTNLLGNQIICHVRAADYLELMHMHQDTRIDVVGRIDAAEHGTVTLVDAELTFPVEVVKQAAPVTVSHSQAYAETAASLPPEQIKILKTLSFYEDLVQPTPVPMAELQEECKLTSTEFKYHSEQLRQAKLIYVTHPPEGPHYQNSPEGAGWLIKNKQNI
jgi:hypothetical protein